MGYMKGKTVLITGGSRGIGRALVELFLTNGYSVAFIEKESGKMDGKIKKKK